MKVKTLLPVVSIVAALALSSCASTKVNSYTDYKFEDIKSVCLQKNFSKRGSKAVEEIIAKSLENLNVKYSEVDGLIAANNDGCTHYMKYSVNKYDNTAKGTAFAFYEVVKDSTRYKRLNNSALRTPYAMDVNNAESVKAVQSIVSDILNNRKTN